MRILILYRFASRGQIHQRVYSQLLLEKVLKAHKAAWFDCLFALLGSTNVKAVHKMMVKLTPVVPVVLLHSFSVWSLWGNFPSPFRRTNPAGNDFESNSSSVVVVVAVVVVVVVVVVASLNNQTTNKLWNTSISWLKFHFALVDIIWYTFLQQLFLVEQTQQLKFLGKFLNCLQKNRYFYLLLFPFLKECFFFKLLQFFPVDIFPRHKI